jgi:hypothetical protein
MQHSNQLGLTAPQGLMIDKYGKRESTYWSAKIPVALIGLAIILLPFSSLPGPVNILREMAGEGAFYPFMLIVASWLFSISKKGKLVLPKHPSVKLLALFILWILVSAAFNLPIIDGLTFKGRSGLEKLIMQLIVTAFVMLSALAVFNFIDQGNMSMQTFRRYILISFMVAGCYSLIEIPALFGQGWAGSILHTLDPLIRDSEHIKPDLARLRSVSGEPSWFAMYCSFIFPWIFSYVFTEKRKSWVYVMLVSYLLAMIVLTESRTAYFITIIESALFWGGIMLFKGHLSTKYRMIVFSAITVILLFLVATLLQDSIFGKSAMSDTLSSLGDTNNESNMARGGSQKAAFGMAVDHPFFGVGLGQYGFYMPSYIPASALDSYEILEWASPGEGTPWPPVHNVFARIAAELGFVGLGIWIAIWIAMIVSCFKRYRKNICNDGKQNIFVLSLMVSIIGVLLAGLNSDSLRFFGFWLILGIAWAYLVRPEKYYKSLGGYDA